MATTNTSNVEFLHPTTTPGRSDLQASVGQNTRIRPSCSTMTDDRYRPKLSALKRNRVVSVVLAQRHPSQASVDAAASVRQHHVSRQPSSLVLAYQMCFLPSEQYDRDEHGEEQSSQADDAPGSAYLASEEKWLAAAAVSLGSSRTHHDSVFRSKDGELIEASNEVPAGSNVPSYEDAEREDGKRVHRALCRLAVHAVGHAARRRCEEVARELGQRGARSINGFGSPICHLK